MLLILEFLEEFTGDKFELHARRSTDEPITFFDGAIVLAQEGRDNPFEPCAEPSA